MTYSQISGDEIPRLLREIAKPPKKLWIEGSLPDCEKFLCVVGARRHSRYAGEAVRSLIKGLSGYNICIVSGLAMGIDSIAHETAMDVGLKTIAFPGSGLDRRVLYPREKVGLAERILSAGGALLSEFDPEQIAQIWTFPQRNRLMAGISHATLVIEAGDNSGTLITSMHAVDEGRDVLALPGEIANPLSYGPHKLIRSGAVPIRSSEDILEALNIRPKVDENNTENLDGPKKGELSNLEIEILKSLKIESKTHNALADKFEIDSTKLNVALSTLEIEGKIEIKNGYIHRR